MFRTCFIVSLFFVSSSFGISEKELTRVLQAIRIVESNNTPSAVGDGGNAIGVYQIWESYWKDATEFSNLGGKYRDCFTRNYSIKVFDAYMKRYAREAWTDPAKFDAEKVARIHNGGPKGYKKTATEKYWKKCLTELNR